MKITQIRLGKLSVPLRTPFKTALRTVDRVEDIVVELHTDTGAVGFHGFVTQLYDPADYDVVLVCGPTVMMKNAARLCAEKGTKCLVSLEKKMACGIGACLGCTIETASGARSVCKDGPVFAGSEVFGWQT